MPPLLLSCPDNQVAPLFGARCDEDGDERLDEFEDVALSDCGLEDNGRHRRGAGCSILP